MSRPIRPLEVSSSQTKELRRVLSRPKASQREARRARIILLRSQGKSQEAAANEVSVNCPVVVRWEKRFRQSGMEGLRGARRSGRKCSIDPAIKASIISEAGREARSTERSEIACRGAPGQPEGQHRRTLATAKCAISA